MRLALTVLLAASVAAVSVPGPLSDKEVFKRGLASLVSVHQLGDGKMVSSGSGALVADDLVLTCAHVIEVDKSEKSAGVILIFASEDLPHGQVPPASSAELMAYDASIDLALLRLARRLPGRLPISLGPAVEVGDAIYYFGNAAETPTTFGRGVETRVNYPAPTHEHWAQFTGLAWFGMSGGPVLDDHGRLTGLIVAVDTVPDPFVEDDRVALPGVGYHVPRRDIAAFLATWAARPLDGGAK